MKDNVTKKFVEELHEIMEKGKKINTRGNEQIEILSKQMILNNSKDRVIILPKRNNNIFALIAETLWVLGGRDDMNYLSYYLPRAKDFSDDGLVWRGAYGPRLRNWYGKDQFQNALELLKKDINTKRCVMTIFDPNKDYVESKDIPCNNWLNFIIRDNKLHLNVAVRANDAIWGFGGINTFEWSVLQEFMAYWTNCECGWISWFAGSFHIYERHYKTAQNIIDNFKNKSVYDYNVKSPKFTTSFKEFDKKMSKWFIIEEKLRNDDHIDFKKAVNEIDDELLETWLSMINIYNMYLHGYDKNDIIKEINSLDDTVYKAAAIEYFFRKYKNFKCFDMSSDIRSFFEECYLD